MMKRLLWLGFGCALLALTGGPGWNTAAAAGPEPQVITMTRVHTSGALARMTPKIALQVERERPVRSPGANAPGLSADPNGKPDDAIDPFAEDAKENMPAPLGGWQGISALLSSCHCAPPDTNGDVGLNYYVQTVNAALQIWDKNGTSLLGPIPNNTLFTGLGGKCEDTNDGDPVVLYDQLADRWFFSQFANVFTNNGPFFQCIAVSATSDPRGAWHQYEFRYPGNSILNDYGKFGVWPDGYYATINQFKSPSFDWEGVGALAFEREKMLNGDPARVVYVDLSNDPWGGMLPSDLDGPAPAAGTPNYFVEIQDNKFDASIPQDRMRVFAFHVDWTNPTNSSFTNVGNPPVAKFSSLACAINSTPCIPQPATTRKLDALGERTMFRAQYRDFGTYASIVTNHTVNAGQKRAGVRWYEIRISGGTPSVYQQSTYGPGDLQRWMGSAAMDKQGNLAIGFSRASATVYPGLGYAGRLASDPLNSLAQGEKVLKKGKGSQTGTSRWGDYSALTVDPADGCTFWYTSEYYQPTSQYNWRTWIGKFKFPGCS